ncbi:superoxide dismutase [Cu-Zn]-like [Haliotis rufescens]|uniref:superoxide dismutase [Cu-Zn]-like n=1 Tax=Haliotis rufescens TaxID=6454 RepID=UPI00201F05A0|nr:superoxide dismutase [Cu-Zn]-like [Haliotis rufescens]XP_046361340.2 superoxide dismutase [Cu-Zn]-like [Haliotis rufescens]
MNLWQAFFQSLHLAFLHERLNQEEGITQPGHVNIFEYLFKDCVTIKYASCILSPDPSAKVNLSGRVDFKEMNLCGRKRPIEIKVNISGFPPTDDVTKHGFHVQTYGNLTDGCTSAGGHYSPFNVNHGAPEDGTRHVGDFGNIDVPKDGQLVTSFTDPLASLDGNQSILGRAIVVHAGEDDLGRGNNSASLENGNAGARLACCVISANDGSLWNEM